MNIPRARRFPMRPIPPRSQRYGVECPHLKRNNPCTCDMDGSSWSPSLGCVVVYGLAYDPLVPLERRVAIRKAMGSLR